MDVNKAAQWTAKINGALAELFNEDSENYIGSESLQDSSDFTLFVHCIANIAPSQIVERLSSDLAFENYLQFNHLANDLCFQFMNKSDD